MIILLLFQPTEACCSGEHQMQADLSGEARTPLQAPSLPLHPTPDLVINGWTNGWFRVGNSRPLPVISLSFPKATPNKYKSN